MAKDKKPSNLKMGLVFGGIALFFFIAVFARRIWMPT